MKETRTVFDPFLNKNVEVHDGLIDRLRGRYGIGPIMENGEPEFGWRQFETSPIQHEAADRIEKLERDLANLQELVRQQLADYNQLKDQTNA